MDGWRTLRQQIDTMGTALVGGDACGSFARWREQTFNDELERRISKKLRMFSPLPGMNRVDGLLSF